MVYLAAFHESNKAQEVKAWVKSKKKVVATSASNGDGSMYSELKNFLDFLRQVVSEGFVKLHSELDELRVEFKTERNAVKL